MTEHLTQYRTGFSTQYTSITAAGEADHDTGMDFGILKLKAGESWQEDTPDEVALLHLEGTVVVEINDDTYTNTRISLFDEAPFCCHVPIKTAIAATAITDCEFAVIRTANHESFPVEIHTPETVANEHRGAGQVDGACLRWVRTIFDDTNSHPNAQLVLGEVVNMPGRWSSYPPHHHPQPEIYHYRFTDPRGFGHAELDDTVLKVRHNDTVKILDEKDHAQCSAPGYGMYYIWAIRHLPSNRYTVPEFTEDHAWTMAPDATFWLPKEEALV